MGQQDEAPGAKAKSEYSHLPQGSPEEKVLQWLRLTKNDDGHFKAGDWMVNLVPHLNYITSDPSLPHPTVTFSFTCQPEHCNRMYNLHGGAAATLFDFCTTMPLALVSRPGFWQFLGVSRTLNVTYYRPIPAGEEVLIRCDIVQVGKKLATIRGTMTRKRDGAVMAACEHGKVNVDADFAKM